MTTNFNSQIVTKYEQSEQLFAMGLKPEMKDIMAVEKFYLKEIFSYVALWCHHKQSIKGIKCIYKNILVFFLYIHIHIKKTRFSLYICIEIQKQYIYV